MAWHKDLGFGKEMIGSHSTNCMGKFLPVRLGQILQPVYEALVDLDTKLVQAVSDIGGCQTLNKRVT